MTDTGQSIAITEHLLTKEKADECRRRAEVGGDLQCVDHTGLSGQKAFDYVVRELDRMRGARLPNPPQAPRLNDALRGMVLSGFAALLSMSPDIRLTNKKIYVKNVVGHSSSHHFEFQETGRKKRSEFSVYIVIPHAPGAHFVFQIATDDYFKTISGQPILDYVVTSRSGKYIPENLSGKEQDSVENEELIFAKRKAIQSLFIESINAPLASKNLRSTQE